MVCLDLLETFDLILKHCHHQLLVDAGLSVSFWDWILAELALAKDLTQDRVLADDAFPLLALIVIPVTRLFTLDSLAELLLKSDHAWVLGESLVPCYFIILDCLVLQLLFILILDTLNVSLIVILRLDQLWKHSPTWLMIMLIVLTDVLLLYHMVKPRDS